MLAEFYSLKAAFCVSLGIGKHILVRYHTSGHNSTYPFHRLSVPVHPNMFLSAQYVVIRADRDPV